jgi:hypothetical protein
MELLSDTSLDTGKEQAPDQIDDQNYAADPEVYKRAMEQVFSLFQPVRDEKLKTRERITRFWKVWNGQHDQWLYQGRAKLYWRLGYKIVETFINHIKPQAFPSDDSFYIEPAPYDPIAMVNAQTARRILKHDVEHSRVERWTDMLLRDGLIQGTGIVKTVWQTRSTKNYKRNIVQGYNDKGKSVMMPMFGAMPDDRLTLKEGPTFSPVNILDWFIHPITARDIEDAELVWEDVTVPVYYLTSMQASRKFVGVDKALAEGDSKKSQTDTSSAKDVLLARQGVVQAEVMRKRPNAYQIQEAYCKFDLYGDGTFVDTKMVWLGSHLLECRQNPNFFQEPPYFAWHCIDVKDYFYGAGIVEPIEHLNLAANAMGNQMLDAIALQVNHILGVNVAMLAQDVAALRISPRAIWASLGDPNEVFKEIRPQDNTQTALAGLQLLSGVMQDVAGAPPVMQGKQSNKDGTTATEIQAVALGAAAGVQSMVRNFEVQVMSPWLQRAWMLEQQYRSVRNATKIAGSAPIKVAPADVAGDFGMRWLVSTMVPPMIAQQQGAADAAQQQGGALPMPAMNPMQTLPGMAPSNGLGTEPSQGV